MSQEPTGSLSQQKLPFNFIGEIVFKTSGWDRLEATILYHNISSIFIVTISTIFHRTSSPDKSASMSNRHGISRWHFLSQLATCSKIEQAASKLHTVDTLYTSRIIKCGMDDIGMCIIMYILYMMYWDDATLSVHPKIFQTELAAPTREKKHRRGHLSAIESWILFLASGRKLSNQGVCT
jgi:hypothetical protein